MFFKAVFMTNINSPHAPLVELLVESSKLFIFSYSPAQERFISWSSNAEDVLGISDEEIALGGNILYRYVHPKDLMSVISAVNGAIKSESSYAISYRWQLPHTKEIRLLHARAEIANSDDGDLLEGIILDITGYADFKQPNFNQGITEIGNDDPIIADKLALYNSIFEAVPTQIIVLNKKGTIRYISPHRDEKFADAVAGKFNLKNFFVGSPFVSCFNDIQQQKAIADAINNIITGKIENYYSRALLEDSFNSVDYTVEMRPLENNGIIICINENTKLLNLEKRLSELKKGDEVRFLAAGVAHNINNCLQSIMAHTAIIQHQADDNLLLKEAIAGIQDSITHASKITKSLTKLGQIDNNSLSEANLNLILLNTLEHQTRPDGVKITITIGAVPTVLVITDALNNCIKALMENAIEAHCSTISITTKTVTLTEYEIQDLAAGTFAALEIRDNGVGMDEETLKRATSPFYTNKKLDNRSGLGLSGDGLGLSGVLAAVRSFGGALNLQSTLNEGTIATIYIPIAKIEKNEELLTEEAV